MDSANDNTKISPGEQLIWSFFKLLQLVKIHAANNQIVAGTLNDFVAALKEMGAGGEPVTIRAYRGRVYINDQKLVCRPSLLATVTKFIDYLQVREVYGLKLAFAAALTSDKVVHFVQLMNQCVRETESAVSWLQNQMAAVGHNDWVELLLDPEYQMPLTDKRLEELARMTQSQAMDTFLNSNEARQVVVASARKSYVHALGSMKAVSEKMAESKGLGIQKPKRAIQDMIEILTKGESILLGMSTIRNYDDYTYTHSVNVAILAMCLASRLGLPRTIIEQVGLCGLFHDLGKVDIPIELINKNGRLTDDEYMEVKKHSMHSVRQIIMLRASYELKSRLLLAPLEHHQGINFTGYPKGIRKRHLSLLGRILGIADFYDALTSVRCYRPNPFSPDKALMIMMGEAGKTLDPLLLKVFVNMIGVFPIGVMVMLDTRELALVVETPKGAVGGRPKVRLLAPGEEGVPAPGEIVDLAERDAQSGQFIRNIVKCVHPSEYGIQASDFLG